MEEREESIGSLLISRWSKRKIGGMDHGFDLAAYVVASLNSEYFTGLKSQGGNNIDEEYSFYGYFWWAHESLKVGGFLDLDF